MTQRAFRTLLLRLVLLPVIVLAVFALLQNWQVHRLQRQAARVDHADAVIAQSSQLLQLMIDQETGVRGFLATGQASFLQPYNEAKTQTSENFQKLRNLTATEAVTAGTTDELSRSFHEFESLNELLVTSQPGGEVLNQELLQQKLTMDSVRALIARIVQEESSVRTTTTAGLKSERRIGDAVQYALLLLILVLIVWSSVDAFRRVSGEFGAQLDEVATQRDWLQTTLTSIGDAVITCDAKGCISFMNPIAEELTQYSVAEAVGKPLSEVFRIVNETTRQTVENPVDKVMRLGTIVGLANHTVLIGKEGKEVAIDDSGAPIFSKSRQIQGVVLVFRDIEERRKAERELARKTAEMEALLANAPIGFAFFNEKMQFLQLNDAFARSGKTAASEAIGKAIDGVIPHLHGALLPMIARVFEDGSAQQTQVFTLHGEGESSSRQWLISSYPVRDSGSGKVISAGAVMVETTSQWQAEEAIRRSEKLAVVGRLSASIAHEMNNPLEGVTNLLYLMGLDDTLNEETRQYLTQASRELERVSRIATQTLRFAKRTSSAQNVQMNELLDGVFLIFAGRLATGNIVVEKRYREVRSLLTHSNEVTQIFTNLVGNALDALRGNGHLLLRIREGSNWKTGQKGVVVIVADNASGIPAEVRQRIWEPFFSTKGERGTGLGLWLVDEMVQNNGGAIRLRSRTDVGKSGSVFRVFLPY